MNDTSIDYAYQTVDEKPTLTNKLLVWTEWEFNGRKTSETDAGKANGLILDDEYDCCKWQV